MTVARPSEYPEWADGMSAVIVEPSGTKKALGWVVEKPPYQFFNWLFNLIFQWVQWFDQGYALVTLVNGTNTSGGSTSPALGKSAFYAVDCTIMAQAFVLPSPASPADNGMVIRLMKTDSSGNAITWTGTISGQVNPTIANQYESQSAVAIGGAWYWLN